MRYLNYTSFILALCVSICLSGCFSKSNISIPPAYDVSSNKDLLGYFEKLEKTILAKDQTAIMELIDKDYIKEQHDQNLSGNTTQFIDELFCGKVQKSESFTCVPLKEITSIKRKSIEKLSEGYRVYYEVSSGNKIVEIDWWITENQKSGTIIFGIFGAMG